MQSQSQQVVQRERARIARDIHDDLTGGLTQLVLLGETAQSELPPESDARRHLNEICEKTRVLLRAMNETIWVVNSQRDTLRDFASYVCKYAETFLQFTPIRCRFDVEPDLAPVPCDVGIRRNLFLGIKEALNNVVRHSGASEVLLRIRREGLRVIVSIEDDGRGFDPASADQERNGMRNMAQRAAEAGGECRLMSLPGAGCQVQFNVPLAGPRWYPFLWFTRKRERPPFRPNGPAVAPARTASPSGKVSS
jgi:signal transduction histidine kinase